MFRKNQLFLTAFLAVFISLNARSQQVTGLWEGKIHNHKVEVKIIQKGDSLTGTSYYYSQNGNYRRYSIKGYFDAETNEVVWWDDRLLEGKDGRTVSRTGMLPMSSRADFNCPGGGKMMLEGKSVTPEGRPEGTVYMEKSYDPPKFPDEWDYVIDNYTTGANHPDVIDSIAQLSGQPQPEPQIIATAPPRPQPTVPQPEPPAEKMVIIPAEKPAPPIEKPQPVAIEPVVTPTIEQPAPAPLTIEQKFTLRKKEFTKEIFVEGDSVELRFYDNAQVDGDSISVFLNDKLIFTHVRLSDKAFSIKLPVAELNDSNELIMVAENLGSIPPNTSYMVAIVGDKRYDAYLASTENSSAMIRLRKR